MHVCVSINYSCLTEINGRMDLSYVARHAIIRPIAKTEFSIGYILNRHICAVTYVSCT